MRPRRRGPVLPLRRRAALPSPAAAIHRLAAGLLGALAVGGAAIGATPVRSEFQVNTYTTASQTLPSVACDADGDFVVVWESLGSSGSDSSSFSVQGRR